MEEKRKPMKNIVPMSPGIPGFTQVKLIFSGSTQFLKEFGEL
jgi:hypothetical protein